MNLHNYNSIAMGSIVSIVVTIGSVRVFLRILELTEHISATLEHAQQELRACDKSLQQCRYDNKRWKNSRRQCKTRVTNCEIQFDDLKRACADRYASYESQLAQKSEVIKQLKRTVVRCSKQNTNILLGYIKAWLQRFMVWESYLS